jgi:hypothetical protein
VTRKRWAKPLLMTLHRGSEEERILSACKYYNHGGGPDARFFQCDASAAPCAACASAPAS